MADPSGGNIELTGAEFDLLLTFLTRPGRVLSRDQLLDLTRGRGEDVLDRSIDVLVSRLRRNWQSAVQLKYSKLSVMAATSLPPRSLIWMNGYKHASC